MQVVAAQQARFRLFVVVVSYCGLVLVSFRRVPPCNSDDCSSRTPHNTTSRAASTMAKARTSLRQAEHINVHEDDLNEEDAQETLGESMDPLEESGHTVDSSDEEVEDSVQEDMARFEETFVGINKRFRLINRIGEGMS